MSQLTEVKEIKGHGAKLGRHREAAIAALQSKSTMKEAARAVGVSEKTMWRWSRDPGIQAEVQEAQRQARKLAAVHLGQGTLEAVEALRRILKNPKVSPKDQIQAARTVLEMNLHYAPDDELTDLKMRLDVLSEKMEGPPTWAA